MYIGAPRGSAMLAACLSLLLATVAVLRFQPAPTRPNPIARVTTTWRTQFEQARPRLDDAQQMFAASSLEREATALVADVRAISLNVRSRLPWRVERVLRPES